MLMLIMINVRPQHRRFLRFLCGDKCTFILAKLAILINFYTPVSNLFKPFIMTLTLIGAFTTFTDSFSCDSLELRSVVIALRTRASLGTGDERVEHQFACDHCCTRSVNKTTLINAYDILSIKWILHFLLFSKQTIKRNLHKVGSSNRKTGCCFWKHCCSGWQT